MSLPGWLLDVVFEILGVLDAGNEEDRCTIEQFNQMHPPTFDGRVAVCSVPSSSPSYFRIFPSTSQQTPPLIPPSSAAVSFNCFFGVFGACRECIFCHRLLPLDFRWGLVPYFLRQIKDDELFACWEESVPGRESINILNLVVAVERLIIDICRKSFISSSCNIIHCH
ncbi:uncharacterized protein LOC121265810 [Juglans microcarpa x Juglans regia]|uniref:uncharacterized protein LOC121265810 n=1 Tax=Juglans microcarpa x Juglans regia TaxID=2249226 RepID=UPI001B7F6A68|nr:uncharacterized protein LOC121265810 [Juglans microcarpa x Juglans regia]